MENKDRKRAKNKSFLLALTACALVIGVSAWLFASDAATEQMQLSETLSVPNTAVEETPGKKPASDAAEQAAPTQTYLPDRVMPVSGDVLQAYAMEALSYNETTRDWRTHGGVDLAAEQGTSVAAAADGTVMAVYEDELLGMTVSLQHADGYTTFYSGLAENVAVSAGQTVQAGQTIGTVGEPALIETALGSHLHFSVQQGGESLDPASFLYN